MIDLSRPLLYPEGRVAVSRRTVGLATLERHGDRLLLDGRSVGFYTSPAQEEGVIGNLLWKELEAREALEAHILEELLAVPELIPESWKYEEQDGARRLRRVFFWGTRYFYGSPSVYDVQEVRVRCLFFFGPGWHSRWVSLADKWCRTDVAAVLGT